MDSGLGQPTERAGGLGAVLARLDALERWRDREAAPHIAAQRRKEGKRDGRRELWADISKILGAGVALVGGIIAVLAFAGLGY